MSERPIEPYQVFHEPHIKDERVTDTIEVIVPLNYLNGSMRFLTEYTFWLASDYVPAMRGPHVFVQYDQYLDTRRCDAIDICADGTITRNIKFVLDYFCFVRQRIEIQHKAPPTLAEFSQMLDADADLKRILIDCDEK
ncbi:MAG: hypothetical protein HY617_02410 [Candidatus Sungbacteria bacterium]|nr:hypothetical protein [Candidatus Sungbacteria bacterium]